MMLYQKPATTKKITITGILIWLIAALFFLYEFFSRTFIGTIANEVMSSFSLSAFQLSMIGSIYYLAYACMQVPVGLIIDRWGVKRPLILATLICTLGIYLFGNSSSYGALLFSRFLMGFGSSFAFVSLLVLALNWFPKRNFGFFSGATQILGAIGPMLAGAPLVALLKMTNDNWRTVMWFVVIVGIILTAMIFLFVKDHPKHFHHFNVKKKPEPTLYNLKRLFQNQQVPWIAYYAFCSYASISLLGAIWGTYYLQTHGLSRDAAAVITSFIWAGLAIGSPLVGFISDKLHNRKKPLYYCAIGGFIVTLAIIYWPTNSKITFSILYFALGFIGAGQTLSFTIMSEHVCQNLRATAMGLNNTSVMLGGTIIPPLIGLIVEHMSHHAVRYGPDHTIYKESSFTIAFLIMPLLYLIGALIARYKIEEAE